MITDIRWARAAMAVAMGMGVGAMAGAAPSAARSGEELTVSQLLVTTGQVNFVLTGPGLPPAGELAAGAVTVSADGTALQTRFVTGATRAVTDLPVRGTIVVVDTGATMAPGTADELGWLAVAQSVAGSYLADLPPDVAVGVVSSADLGTVVQDLTYDRAAAATAVSSLAAAGGSTVNDAVLLAADQLDSSYVERRIVVLTNGVDQAATASLNDVGTVLTQNTGIAMDLVQLGTTGQASLEAASASSGGVVTGVAVRGDEVATPVATLVSQVSEPLAVSATVPAGLAGEAELIVRVDTGATTLAVTTTVALLAEAVPSPSATPSPTAAESEQAVVGAETTAAERATVRLHTLSNVILYTALGLVALAVVAVVFLIASAVLGRSAIRERRRQLALISGKRRAVEVKESPEGSALMRTALAVSERAVAKQGRATVESQLERAGLALRPAEWILVRAMTALVCAVLLALVIPWYLGLIVGVPGGWLLSDGYRKFRTNRRQTKFGDLLPDALQLVVGALRSGFSLMQALDAVVREGPEPVASEFGRALAESRLGGDVEAALERTAERNGSNDLNWLVMAIRIQREVGGNLSEVMETAVETMRERGRLVRHVRALSAEGKLSAYVLVGMPIAIAGWMAAFRGEYLEPLYSETIGLVMIAAGVLMVVAGAFWISRLVKVEV